MTEAYDDGTNWFRRWSDGWLEQGGSATLPGNDGLSITLIRPYSGFYNAVASPLTNHTVFYQGNPVSVNTAMLTTLTIGAYNGAAKTVVSWQACGRQGGWPWICNYREGGFQTVFLLLFCNYRGLTEEIFDKGNEVTEENGFYGFKNIV